MVDQNEDIGKINDDSSSDEEVIDSQNIQEELIEEKLTLEEIAVEEFNENNVARRQSIERKFDSNMHRHSFQ